MSADDGKKHEKLPNMQSLIIHVIYWQKAHMHVKAFIFSKTKERYLYLLSAAVMLGADNGKGKVCLPKMTQYVAIRVQ